MLNSMSTPTEVLAFQEEAVTGRFLLSCISLDHALLYFPQETLAALDAGDQPGDFPFPPSEAEQRSLEKMIAT